MSAYTLDCPPIDTCGPCGTLPSGFVRLRYFFGKRMGVADFVDEQRYHAGKLRFHNQHLHGAGLLCGLGVTRQSPTDVVLRVGKGAAIDDCGREIVVGYDQCIDLDAWYQRTAAERRVTDPAWPAAALDGGNLPLVVAIRYRECAAGPEPAPRDTCSCDATSCDLGRVREEFELQLFAPDALEVAGQRPLIPARADLERVLANAVGADPLAAALAGAAQAPVTDPDAERWLPLASFALVLSPAPTASEPGHVTDVVDLEGMATLLAETALLQELLLRDIGAQLEAGALVTGGPVIAGLTLLSDGSGTHWLDLALTGPVVAGTVPGTFTLARLDPTSSTPWTTASVTTEFAAATATDPDRIRIQVNSSFLVADGLYRLAGDPPRSTPIVDEQLRPLLPLRPALHFSIVEPTSGSLELAPAPFAR